MSRLISTGLLSSLGVFKRLISSWQCWWLFFLSRWPSKKTDSHGRWGALPFKAWVGNVICLTWVGFCCMIQALYVALKGLARVKVQASSLTAVSMFRWRREVRIKKGSSRWQGETWYYGPCGKRMKQFPEVIKVKSASWRDGSVAVGGQRSVFPLGVTSPFDLCYAAAEVVFDNSLCWAVVMLPFPCSDTVPVSSLAPRGQGGILQEWFLLCWIIST